MKIRNIRDAISTLEDCANTIRQKESLAEAVLDSLAAKLRGRRILAHRTGRLKGDYEITSVGIRYDGKIEAFGLKVLTNGKLGSQAWDLGPIDLHKIFEREMEDSLG